MTVILPRDQFGLGDFLATLDGKSLASLLSNSSRSSSYVKVVTLLVMPIKIAKANNFFHALTKN